jgi:hypothetical protein
MANPTAVGGGYELPSAYTNLHSARQKHGARADKYVGLFMHRGLLTSCELLKRLIGFQVCRVNTDFYDKFYQAEPLSDTVRETSLRVSRKS